MEKEIWVTPQKADWGQEKRKFDQQRGQEIAWLSGKYAFGIDRKGQKQRQPIAVEIEE